MPAHVDAMLRDKSARWAARVAINKDALRSGESELMMTLPDGPRLRITQAAAPGQVLVSNVVRELCAGGLAFEPLEGVQLKGFSGQIALFLAGPTVSIGSESE